MKLLLAGASLIVLAGCAGVGAADCGPDWHAIGQRDGVLGVQPQDENYARRCAGAVDAVRYREGWEDGFRRRPKPPV
jgi:hypothetical protein